MSNTRKLSVNIEEKVSEVRFFNRFIKGQIGVLKKNY